MAQHHNELELASTVWHKLSFEKLCKLKRTDLEDILRLVDQEDELLNSSIPAGKSTVAPSKSGIRDMKIKNLMEKTSNDDIWLSLPELVTLTGYKKNTLYQLIPRLGVTVKRHNVCNANLISAQSFCRAYFNISSENRNSSTVTQDRIGIGSDTNYKSDLRFRDFVFQFHP